MPRASSVFAWFLAVLVLSGAVWASAPSVEIRPCRAATALAAALADGGLGGLTVGVNYARDAAGRPTVVTTDGGSSVVVAQALTFDAGERLTGALFGNGVTASWTFDPVRQRLRAIEYRTASALLATVAYPEYDADGNLTREQRYDRDGALLSDKAHGYDELGRLESTSLWRALGNSAQAFTYSPAGNVATAGDDVYVYGRADLPQP